jgi:hypothetical protein
MLWFVMAPITELAFAQIRIFLTVLSYIGQSLLNSGHWGRGFLKLNSSTTSLWPSDIVHLLLNSGQLDLEFPELNIQSLAIRHCLFAS